MAPKLPPQRSWSTRGTCGSATATSLKGPLQRSAVPTSALFLFCQGDHQGGPCPCSPQPVPTRLPAAGSPSPHFRPLVLLGLLRTPVLLSASFWKSRRYGDWMQLHRRFVVHLFPSEAILQLLCFLLILTQIARRWF